MSERATCCEADQVYPLATVGNPPAQRFVDMTDTVYDGPVRYDESTGGARTLNEEPAQREPPNDGHASPARYREEQGVQT